MTIVREQMLSYIRLIPSLFLFCFKGKIVVRSNFKIKDFFIIFHKFSRIAYFACYKWISCLSHWGDDVDLLWFCIIQIFYYFHLSCMSLFLSCWFFSLSFWFQNLNLSRVLYVKSIYIWKNINTTVINWICSWIVRTNM